MEACTEGVLPRMRSLAVCQLSLLIRALSLLLAELPVLAERDRQSSTAWRNQHPQQRWRIHCQFRFSFTPLFGKSYQKRE
ncbi:unnamed protein product [Caenorhabditis auriculariae]|uniref:Secreted protein n=1 Tax=Caenorhabditis auriculariae TaxID=2777116 RepID=A0A8S1HHY5_9PELO|nr:unnamed protein product [Caenorhabditis auriculariae]